jgi:hypothetical protein
MIHVGNTLLLLTTQLVTLYARYRAVHLVRMASGAHRVNDRAPTACCTEINSGGDWAVREGHVPSRSSTGPTILQTAVENLVPTD